MKNHLKAVTKFTPRYSQNSIKTTLQRHSISQDLQQKSNINPQNHNSFLPSHNQNNTFSHNLGQIDIQRKPIYIGDQQEAEKIETINSSQTNKPSQDNHKPVLETNDNLISTVTQSQISMEQESATTEINTELIGHASPRWEHRRGALREELNLNLSKDRVNEVETYLREIFTQRMINREAPIFSFINQCIDVDIAKEKQSSDPISITSSAEGDMQTIREAEGNISANNSSMRRVEIKVSLTRNVTGDAPFSEAITHPERCEPNATKQWSIKLGISGGAGHAGVGGAFAIGKLKNRLTEQVAEGSFIGGGLGLGLQTPGATSDKEDWVDFSTEEKCRFEDFDGTPARFTSAGAGIGLGGYSLAYISFPLRGANSIYVGGFNMGAMGADAGTNVGVWNIHGTPPQPQCEPKDTLGITSYIPYQFNTPNNYAHTVLFETGSSRINDLGLQQLEMFVDSIIENNNFPEDRN